MGAEEALAVPFSLLPPLQSGSGNPRHEAPVSQTVAFLQDGWCLAPLQAPVLPSSCSTDMHGGACSVTGRVRGTWGCCTSRRTVLALDGFPVCYNLSLSLLPACHSLDIKGHQIPFKVTWAEHVANLSWGSSLGPSSATEQRCEVDGSKWPLCPPKPVSSVPWANN